MEKEQTITVVDVSVDAVTHGLTVSLDARFTDPEHYTGTVDGHPFWLMLASRETAERELAKAERRVAAWHAIINDRI